MTQNSSVQRMWLAGLALCVAVVGVSHATAQVASVSPIESILGPPQTFEDFWKAIDRDLDLGLWDRAKTRLEALLAHPDLNPDNVLAMREKYGSAMLLKLQNREETRALSAKLVEMANEASVNKSRNPERIRHYISQLTKSPGERQYALDELRRSGSYAVPYFIEAIEANPNDQIALMFGLLSMSKSSWPAVAAATRSENERIADLMLEALDRFGVPESAESLWFLAASPKVSKSLQTHARQVLARLVGVPAGNLPPAATTLSKIANDYYEHRSWLSRLSGPQDIWEWSDGRLNVTAMEFADAEEILGIKRAREALELSPELHEARVTLISLALQRSYERIGIDQNIPGTQEGVLELILSAGPDLISDVLDRAMKEKRTAVVLGAVRSLGRTGNQSLLFGPNGSGVLARALDYPSARVQAEAAFATLNIHPRKPFPRSPRVVHTLVRSLARDTRPNALIADPNSERANNLGTVLTELGYVSRISKTGRETFDVASKSGAVDLILIEPTIRNWNLDETLVNLRADPRTSGLPIVLTSRPEIESQLTELTQRFPGVITVPESPSKELLKAALGTGFNDPMETPLTPAEKAANQRRALEWTLRLARGEFPVMSAEPAVVPLLALLPSAELGPVAADALGYLPSAQVQAELAKIVVSETHTIPLRVAAADALARNIQRGGPALSTEMVKQLQASFNGASDQQLRLAMAQAVGAAGPTGEEMAQRLQRFQPLTAADVDRAGMIPRNAENPAEAETPAEKPAEEAEPKPQEEEKKPAPKPSFFDQ